MASDARLLKRMAGGCAQSFERFYGRHADALYRFALAVASSRVLAEEAVQETFLHALEHPERFHEVRNPSARPWLYGLLRNRLRSLLGPQRVETNSEQQIEQHSRTLEGEAILQQTHGRLRQAILELPLPQREALVMCCLQDVDYRVAAEIFDVPVGTVRSRINRARASLRQIFEQEDGVSIVFP